MTIHPGTNPGFTLLKSLEAHVAIHTIDELWLFPTNRLGQLTSTVAVISAFHDRGPRRRVFTAHLSIRADAARAATETCLVTEHGIVPGDRVHHLVDGVARRLSDQFSGPPYPASIRGDAERWAKLLLNLPDGA